MQYLKADTITEVTIGPAVAVGDGFTPVTNLVGSTADEFEIIKHGATTTTTIAGTLAAITGADGYYALDLSATDTNTEGRLTLLINDDSLILPLRHEFMVVNANVFDSLFAAATTDYLQVDTIQVGGTTQTAGDIPALVTTVDTVVDGIQTDLSNATDGLGAIKTDTAAILVDTSTTLQAELDGIQADTEDLQTQIGTAGAGLTNLGGFSTTAKGQINTEADTALTDYDPPTRTELTADKDELITYLPDVLIKGTADSGSTTTCVDAIRTEADTDYFKGSVILFTGGTIAGQARMITGFTPASDTITFAPATTQAVGTNTYTIIPVGGVDTVAINSALLVGDGNATPWDGV